MVDEAPFPPVDQLLRQYRSVLSRPDQSTMFQIRQYIRLLMPWMKYNLQGISCQQVFFIDECQLNSSDLS